MRYNLLTYGTLETLTESGTGNVELTADNLSVLVDGVFDSSYYYIPAGSGYHTVWNWDDKSSDVTLSSNCLTMHDTVGSRSGIRGRTGVSTGKWYWETHVDAGTYNLTIGVAVAEAPFSNYIGGDATDAYSYSYRADNGYLYHAGTYNSFGDSYGVGSVIGISIDIDNNSLWFSKNGVWQGSGSPDPSTGSGPLVLGSNTYFPALSVDGHGQYITANFGASSFDYPVPSGFNAGFQIGSSEAYMSSVSLETTDTLYIYADLSNRIQIDDIRMYLSSSTSSGTILGNINFYYKEELSDNYTQLDKNYNTDYFYADNLSGTLTPRYLRFTITNTECILNEIEAYNDDDIVDFGSDGLLTEYVVTENTPDYVYSIPIFNDNISTSLPVHAYVAVDYTNSGTLNHAIGISSSSSGPFYTLSNGLIIDDNYESSTYAWDDGTHSNTKEENGYLVLDLPTYSGTYQTTVFKFNDPYMSSYLSIGVTTESGTTAVGYDDNIFDSTIEVRSSNTEPMVLAEVHWIDYATPYIYTYYNDGTEQLASVYTQYYNSAWGIFYLRSSSTGRSVRSHRDQNYTSTQNYYYDVDGAPIASPRCGAAIYPNLAADLDIYDNVWSYGDKNNGEFHLTHSHPTVCDMLADTYKDGHIDFVADFAVELNGTGIWYTDKTSNNLVHLDSVGSTLGAAGMPSVGSIASTSDNGCWVIDTANNQAFAFDCDSVPLTVVNLNRAQSVDTINRMDTDRDDGFWYYSDDGYVCRVDKYGKLGVEIPTSLVVTKVTGGDGIVMIYGSSEKKFEIYNIQGYLLGSKTITASNMCFFPTLMHSVDGAVNPQSYDPVWGENGSLKWNVVKNDGYFLPKTTYHQVKLTLRTHDVEKTPIVHNVVVPPAVKIQDIYPQQSRNVYFKSNLSGEAHGDYETDLKVWWEI